MTPNEQARQATHDMLMKYLDGPATLRLTQMQVDQAIADSRQMLLPDHSRQFEADIRARLTTAILFHGLGR